MLDDALSRNKEFMLLLKMKSKFNTCYSFIKFDNSKYPLLANELLISQLISY